MVTNKRIAKVQVEYVVEVEFPEDFTDDSIRFLVEEKNCHWTGSVGATISTLEENHNEAGTCFGCAHDSKCTLLTITNLTTT